MRTLDYVIDNPVFAVSRLGLPFDAACAAAFLGFSRQCLSFLFWRSKGMVVGLRNPDMVDRRLERAGLLCVGLLETAWYQS